MKTEPSAYSIDDMRRDKRTYWDGVRNYQARNFMRDEMALGDRVLFYHSNTVPTGVVGVVEVSKTAHADPSQFDKNDPHYDPKATKETPRWYCVDVRFVAAFAEPVTLSELKENPFFDDMGVTQEGNRLSVQPVAKKHFDRIVSMGTRS